MGLGFGVRGSGLMVQGLEELVPGLDGGGAGEPEEEVAVRDAARGDAARGERRYSPVRVYSEWSYTPRTGERRRLWMRTFHFKYEPDFV